MAYSAVPTKATGETWSAADNNTYIKDNMAAMAPDIFEAKGDLFVATAADTGARLAVGTNGYIFKANSAAATGVEWAATGAVAARYKVAATKTAATGATPTIVQYDTAVFDTADPDAVTTGAAWKFTAPETGYYWVAASAVLQASTAWAINEGADLRLYKGGTLYSVLGGQYMVAAAGSAYRVFLYGSGIVQLDATNYCDVRLLHNSGGNETIDSDGDFGHIAIVKLF